MSQTQHMDISATGRSPDMPRRQGWNTDDILCMGDDYTYADAAKEIMFLWDEWADSVEKILHGMIDQMEELDISYGDYLNFLKQLASYPTRPALPAAHSHTMSDSFPSDVWHEWADAIESIHDDMKRAIDHSVPLPRGAQVLCAGQATDSGLHLSNQSLSPMHMAAFLRKMLQDRTVARDGLADFMLNLSI